MYQAAKDFFVPLIAPTVAIVVPTILFFVIPRKRDRQKAALDLFTAYAAEDMRKCRREVWDYFVAQVNGNQVEQDKRFDQYLDYFTEDRATRSVAPETVDRLQKASRVLDFFVFVDMGIQHRLVNEELIRVLIAPHYLWWRDRVMAPMRKRRRIDGQNAMCGLMWWRPLARLDRIANVPAKPAAALGQGRLSRFLGLTLTQAAPADEQWLRGGGEFA